MKFGLRRKRNIKHRRKYTMTLRKKVAASSNTIRALLSINETDRPCSMNRRVDKCTDGKFARPSWKDHFEDLDVNGRTVFKGFRRNMRMWTRLIWIRKKTDSCKHDYKPPSSTEVEEVFWSVEFVLGDTCFLTSSKLMLSTVRFRNFSLYHKWLSRDTCPPVFFLVWSPT